VKLVIEFNLYEILNNKMIHTSSRLIKKHVKRGVNYELNKLIEIFHFILVRAES